MLRRFYRCAEDVLFPDALIDKLIGDEVMALYLPALKPGLDGDWVPAPDARTCPRADARVGYGSGEAPFVELGVGLDVGEAFVGNIGQRALFDFTAVGDVVNTASRLQGQAAGGEVVFSDRVAAGLPASGAHRPPRAQLEGQGRAADRVPGHGRPVVGAPAARRHLRRPLWSVSARAAPGSSAAPGARRTPARSRSSGVRARGRRAASAAPPPSAPRARRASPGCAPPAARAGAGARSSLSSRSSTRSTPARLSPSSVVISWMRRRRSTSLCE